MWLKRIVQCLYSFRKNTTHFCFEVNLILSEIISYTFLISQVFILNIETAPPKEDPAPPVGDADATQQKNTTACLLAGYKEVCKLNLTDQDVVGLKPQNVETEFCPKNGTTCPTPKECMKVYESCLTNPKAYPKPASSSPKR